jgi:hypothetical protein
LGRAWFSFAGSKEVFDRLVEALFFRDEARARRRGVAMQAEGKGYQELIRAANSLTKAEQDRLKLMKQKADTMRALGMKEEAVAIVVEREMARIEAIAEALSVLRRHAETGMIVEVHVEELPPATDSEMP